MEKRTETPQTLQEAIAYFADPGKCFEYAVKLRWPSGKVTCPRCDSDKHSFISSRRIWFCKNCERQFTMKVGTIFEDSPLGMDKWMTAMWLLVNCKNGISSCEIARDLGISQKSAWFMAHRLRLAMQNGSFKKLGGEVEVDETFIGGKARNMHLAKKQRRITGCGTVDKVPVMGILKRGGEVRTMVVDNRKKKTLQVEVNRHVRAGAALYSDELLSYEGLGAKYAHQVIDHAVSYVEGNIHTNGLENYWALLKRGIAGTYVSVEPFHLFRYLDEQAFRYNNRKDMTDAERFELAMGDVFGKRVTFSQLTGNEQFDARQAN
ncbi:MAG: IS1595 family transposase [Acidobacteria bacterium]|nr:IS1595 family transposase [Acidobacteriota bacterium]